MKSQILNDTVINLSDSLLITATTDYPQSQISNFHWAYECPDFWIKTQKGHIVTRFDTIGVHTIYVGKKYGDWLTLQCDQFPQNELA